jgi:magnesium-transporting ATPase (P-type)
MTWWIDRFAQPLQTNPMIARFLRGYGPRAAHPLARILRAERMPVAVSEPISWQALDVHSTVVRLATDMQRGLEVDAIGGLRVRFGPNELPAARQRRRWRVFLDQFKSPLIYLLFRRRSTSSTQGST